MRKVIFTEWIPVVKDKVGNKVSGGTWSDEREGMFHQWGLGYEDSGSYTVAIVEREDGTVAEVLPSKLRFVEPQK